MGPELGGEPWERQLERRHSREWDAARARVGLDFQGLSPWGQGTLVGGLRGELYVSVPPGKGGDLYLSVDLL